MSIYTTLWTLRFPASGDDFIGCDWVDVTAQGVPPHIGTPTLGHGYERGDPSLLVISGREYRAATFESLHRRICDALRGDGPRVVAQIIESGGRIRTIREGDDPK